jgi:DNA-binding transcriptional LysR family regulator
LGLVDLNLLVVFDALMHERNLTRAGRRIGLSHPTASHALGKLRQMRHDDLFIRTPEGMQPTPHGEEMAEPVGDALRMLSIALKAGSFDPANSTRGFNVAVNHYASRAVVPALARNVSNEAPRVSLDVRSLDTGNVLDQLDAGWTDVALTTWYYTDKNSPWLNEATLRKLEAIMAGHRWPEGNPARPVRTDRRRIGKDDGVTPMSRPSISDFAGTFGPKRLYCTRTPEHLQ